MLQYDYMGSDKEVVTEKVVQLLSFVNSVSCCPSALPVPGGNETLCGDCCVVARPWEQGPSTRPMGLWSWVCCGPAAEPRAGAAQREGVCTGPAGQLRLLQVSHS